MAGLLLHDMVGIPEEKLKGRERNDCMRVQIQRTRDLSGGSEAVERGGH